MIPFYKAFSLILRVFSKPLLNYTKQVHANRQVKHLSMRQFFIRLGNYYHRVDSTINRKFLKINSQFAFKPLSDELALEKGIQFFYQIIFYMIVIGLPVYQLWRGSLESAQKAAKIDEQLKNLEQGTEQAMEKLDKVLVQLNKTYRYDVV